jgi:hypothetical protein
MRAWAALARHAQAHERRSVHCPLQGASLNNQVLLPCLRHLAAHWARRACGPRSPCARQVRGHAGNRPGGKRRRPRQACRRAALELSTVQCGRVCRARFREAAGNSMAFRGRGGASWDGEGRACSCIAGVRTGGCVVLSAACTCKGARPVLCTEHQGRRILARPARRRRPKRRALGKGWAQASGGAAGPRKGMPACQPAQYPVQHRPRALPAGPSAHSRPQAESREWWWDPARGWRGCKAKAHVQARLFPTDWWGEVAWRGRSGAQHAGRWEASSLPRFR